MICNMVVRCIFVALLIHLSFLYVGHTHEDVDAAFSKVSQKLKCVDVETLPELFDILPEPEPIGKVYDVKQWMQPYLSSLEKISFPLHYKFERNQDKVNIFYKGPHYNDWIQMEDSILPRKPPGKSMKLTPDYTRINVDRNIKQVEQLKQLFKNENSFDFWNQFYKAIKDNTRQIPESSWILDELHRQGDIPTIEETNIPSHLKDIISKETTVPQVVVRRKITSQSKQQTTKRKQTVKRKKQASVNRSKQGKPNGKRRVVTVTKTVIISVIDEVKRYIWLWIFIFMMNIAVSILILLVMILCCQKPSAETQHQETKRNTESLQTEENIEKQEEHQTERKQRVTSLDDDIIAESSSTKHPIEVQVIKENGDDANRRPTSQTSTEGDAVCSTKRKVYKAVKDWLPEEMIDKYGEKFIENGFENEMFISSMTDKDLGKIGVKTDGEKLTLLLKIRTLPEFKIAPEIPIDLSDWLDKIGLEQYKENFMNASIKSTEVMEALKSFGKKDIINQLNIVKRGHVKRLLYAIEQMRQPTKREENIEKARTALLETRIENCSDQLQTFWTHLIELCLVPQSSAFGSENTLKEKLSELRNTWLVIFALSNILWLILIFTLAAQGHLLSVFGGNPVGFIVLVLFGFILIMQFLAMFVHRFSTLKHFLARAPYFRSSGKNVIYSLRTVPFEDTEHSVYNNPVFSPP